MHQRDFFLINQERWSKSKFDESLTGLVIDWEREKFPAVAAAKDEKEEPENKTNKVKFKERVSHEWDLLAPRGEREGLLNVFSW